MLIKLKPIGPHTTPQKMAMAIVVLISSESYIVAQMSYFLVVASYTHTSFRNVQLLFDY